MSRLNNRKCIQNVREAVSKSQHPIFVRTSLSQGLIFESQTNVCLFYSLRWIKTLLRLYSICRELSARCEDLCPLRAVRFWSSIYRCFVDVRTLHSVPHSCLEWFFAKIATWLKGLAMSVRPTLWYRLKISDQLCDVLPRNLVQTTVVFSRGWNDEPLTLHLVPRIQWNLQNEIFLTGIVNIFKTLKEGAVSFPGASWHSTLRTLDLCTYIHQLWKKGSSGLGLRSADFQTMTAHCILLPTDLTSPTAPGRRGREIKPRHKRLLQAKCPVTGN